jgi:F-type H+-transporting ATPase subunit epsilon
MSNLNLEIISPTGILFKGNCHMAVVPATEGEIGLMKGHEIIITTLKTGQLLVLDEKQNQIAQFDIASGFAKMQDADNLLILID